MSLRGARGARAVLVAGVIGVMGCSDRAPTPGERSPEPAAAAGPTSGVVVAVGGGLSRGNDAVYGAILAARLEGGPICVIPTASATPDRSMSSAVEAFDQHGGPGTALGLLLSLDDPGAVHADSVAERLSGCGGFWFTGGVQSRVVRLFRPGDSTSAAFRAIRDRVAAGAVVSGSSAGAAILSDPMIAGGSSLAALERGAGPDGGVEIEAGMGFAAGLLLDQHFLARGRVARLIVAVGQRPEYEVGFGIDENTALVIEGEEARVVGESGVVLVDGRGLAVEPGGGIDEVRLELLAPGDRVALAGLTISPSAGATPVPLAADGIPAVEDPFERRAFQALLVGLATSEATEVTAGVEGFHLTLRKGEGFRALAGGDPADADDEGPGIVSAGPFLLTVVPAPAGPASDPG